MDVIVDTFTFTFTSAHAHAHAHSVPIHRYPGASSSYSSSNACSLAASALEAQREAAAAVTNNSGSNSNATSSGEAETAHLKHQHQQYSKAMAHDYPSSGDESSSSLLDPHAMPCLHTIRQTFHRIQRRTKHTAGVKPAAAAAGKTQLNATLYSVGMAEKEEEDFSDTASSESGYAGSASSNNETDDNQQTGSGEDSSEESGNDESNQRGQEVAGPRKLLRPKAMPHQQRHNSSSVSSSEIADFSSTEDSSFYATASASPTTDEDGDVGLDSSSTACPQQGRKRSWSMNDYSSSSSFNNMMFSETMHQHRHTKKRRVPSSRRSPVLLEGKAPIMALGCDLMAHVLTFLEPPNVLDVLTMPLSRDWLTQYTRQPELWRVLCVLEPFKASIERQDGFDNDNDDTFVGLFPFSESALLFASNKDVFGKCRLLYSSFVKCMRYLVRIKDDAVNGRPLSVVAITQDSIIKSSSSSFGANRNLREFLSQARGAATAVEQVASQSPVGVFDNNEQVKPLAKRQPSTATKGPKIVKYGHSKLTQRLLGPSAGGSVAEIELPWSCAIYSIVNWMVAFSNVEGIQTMCLKVLPFLLEDEQQRITAQRVGLTDVILRCMLLFRNSTSLHTAAFHTIVLLARPLGGREGMLFHTSMLNSSGIFGSNSHASSSTTQASGKSGMAVLLDSMRRFRRDSSLQAMACWSLVNIALAPAQKEVLVKLGGVEVTVQAMIAHPLDAEVQFRALFALINLVIPCTGNEGRQGSIQESVDDTNERDVLDEMVHQIIDLVVLSIKNFCANEAILNRACLVLHNLSLTPSYHAAMLSTPTCYQMLEWCLSNFRTDQVLQQSAAGTLHRLQMALSSDVGLRTRFALAVQHMQQESLKQAHREALTLSAREEPHRAVPSVETRQGQ